MQAKTRGIILHQTRYGDNASIVGVYTREFGRVAYYVRSVSKKRSTIRAALLQPLSVVELDVYHNPKKEIQALKEMRIAEAFFHIPFEPVKNTIALFIAEVLFKILKHPTPDAPLYHFIEQAVVALDRCGGGLGNFHLVFLAGLSDYLGFSPQLPDDDNLSYFDMEDGVFGRVQPQHPHYLHGEATQRFRLLYALRFDSLDKLPLTRRQRAESLEHFIEFFRLHLPDLQELKSVEVMHHLWD